MCCSRTELEQRDITFSRRSLMRLSKVWYTTGAHAQEGPVPTATTSSEQAEAASQKPGKQTPDAEQQA